MDSALGLERKGEGHPATIADAYNELSQEAFAVWMRLLVARDSELAKGRGPVADMLGYSEGRSNAILRELKHKEYIEFVKSDRIGEPTLIRILRRALVSGPSRIIRIGGELPTHSSPKMGRIVTHQHTLQIKVSSESEFGHDKKMLADCPKCQKYNGLCEFHSTQKPTREFSHNLEMVTKSGPITAHGIPDKNKGKKRKKYVGLYGGYAAEEVCDSKTDLQQQIAGRISLSKMQASKHKDTENRKKEKKTAIRKKSKRKSKDFTKLDKNGRPLVKFDCTDAERREYIAILDRPKSHPLRRRLVSKIEEQAGRLYTRYRREFNPTWEMEDREREYMSRFGILCLKRGITPTQFLDYWRVNIKTFANANLDIIPPNLVASPALVDTVACTASADTNGGKRKWKPTRHREEPVPVHSYDDTSRLDKRLRKGLESAGFNTSAYSDRHLMSIQSAAIHKAKGMDIFVGGAMRPMVDWAAKNIYKRLRNED